MTPKELSDIRRKLKVLNYAKEIRLTRRTLGVEAVSKTGVGENSAVGSNPTLFATFLSRATSQRVDAFLTPSHALCYLA